MNPKTKTILLWVLSVVFMLFFVVYQRLTGPTHPVRVKTEISGETFKYKLLRSWGEDGDAKISIEVPNKNITAVFNYKRFKSFDDWTAVNMEREGDNLIAYIPHQPPAGKVMYTIDLKSGTQSISAVDEPIVLRFTGTVPKYILWPHILFIFSAMVFAIRAGIEALIRGKNIFNYTKYTVIFFALGGLILGPIVQKYAFDAYWTGWPFGHDLTDNKTLVAFVFWVVALFKTMKNKEHRTWVIVAAVALIAVYLIPHSVLGSEIDYTQMPTE